MVHLSLTLCDETEDFSNTVLAKFELGQKLCVENY